MGTPSFCKGLLGQKFYFKRICTHTGTVGDAALWVNWLWLPAVSVSSVRADQACHGGLCAVLNTRDVAWEHTWRADISADGPGSLCAAEFISARSLASCPDFQMSQNPRQIDKILQFCTDSVSYGGWEGRLFPKETWMSGNPARNGICMKSCIWSREGQPLRNASEV